MDFSLIKSCDQHTAMEIYDASMHGKIGVNVGHVSGISNMLLTILHQNPELLNVHAYNYREGILSSMVVPQYCYTQEKAAGLLAECNEEADSIAEKIRNSRLSTYDSVIRVHDILARKVKYEYDLSYEDHSIVGALLTQTGCCESISKAFKFILDKLEIPCLCVSGDAYDAGRGKRDAHMWNMVCISGNWCHVDVTFDLAVKGFTSIPLFYFGLDDLSIKRDHTIDQTYNYPKAVSAEMDYFKKNNREFGSLDVFKKYISDMLRLGKDQFEMRMSYSFSGGEVHQMIDRSVSEALSMSGVPVSLEWYYSESRMALMLKAVKK